MSDGNDAMAETERDPAEPATQADAVARASRGGSMTGTERDAAAAATQPAPAPTAPHGAQPVPAAPAPSATGSEPGRVWGIVSLALAVIPLLQLVGLAAGVVGLVLSARAGRRNGFALAGIAVSLLLLAAAGLFVVLFAFSGYELFGGSVGDVVTVCSELGPGEHVVDGLSYSCP